jgi:hypothetical protein
MRRVYLLTMCAILISACVANDQKTHFSCTDFFSFDGSQTTTAKAFELNPETMAWNWFACLNQQNNPETRVWEGLKPTDQVFLPDGSVPLPYEQRLPPPTAVVTKAKAQGMDVSGLFHNINSEQQVDGLILEMGGAAPAAQKGKAVRYQLLMQKDTFDYISQKKVYNANGQAALTANLNFPATAWELKTSWLWIGSDNTYLQQLKSDGYYIVQAYYLENGVYQVGYAALSGMHVINKLFTDWVWITFENKNNGKYTVTNAIPAEPMTNTTGPTAAATKANNQFQAAYPVLASYELIGVEYQFNQQPILLANSQMESAFQSNSSCISCHSTSAYSADKGYFNFALAEQGGIVYPTAPLPDSDFVDYNKLDFVWSLKRAQWKR